MIKIRRILFPTDFSQNANAALAYACGMAEQNDAELHLLHVIDLGYLMPMLEFDAAGGVDFASIETAANKRLHEVVAPEWAKTHRVFYAIRRGPPFLEIVFHARKLEIDLIVMSTHGRTGLPHVFLGSVAENVVRKAPCPVLTVHPADHSFVMP